MADVDGETSKDENENVVEMQKPVLKMKQAVQVTPPSYAAFSPCPSSWRPSPVLAHTEQQRDCSQTGVWKPTSTEMGKPQVAPVDTNSKPASTGLSEYEDMEIQDLKLEIKKLGLDTIFCFSREDLIDRLRKGRA